MFFITGSIAHSAKRWYLSYSEADFEFYRPAGATCCTDGVKFGVEEGNFLLPKVPSSTPNFTAIGATIRV